MIDIKELEHLARMANEMLSGLHADEAMKRRILFAANEKTNRRAPMPRLVPALCCAALAIACVSAFAPRLSGTAVNAAATPTPVSIDSMAAGGLSNVAEAGQTIYAVSGLDANTAVACEVGGNMRLFQRASYAGKGPGGLGLEDTFSVRGQVAELTLSGVGTLTGEAANDAVATLLDHATLKSADMSAKKQTLTATLTNGLKLQLGVSGDTVSACGGWSCPEFFEAFESGL